MLNVSVLKVRINQPLGYATTPLEGLLWHIPVTNTLVSERIDSGKLEGDCSINNCNSIFCIDM